jgi:hypothetical protein
VYSGVSLHTGFSQVLERKGASTYELTYRPQAKLYNPVTLKMTTQSLPLKASNLIWGYFLIAATVLQNFLCMLATLHSQCATAMKTAVII